MSSEATARRATRSRALSPGQRRVLETTQNEIEELEHSEAFEVFQKQLGLLRKRLLNSPQSLRQVFIDDGTQAIVWEFKQDAARRQVHQDAVEPAAARRRHELDPAALHLEPAAQVQAQVHRRDRRPSVGPLSDVQGPVEELARRRTSFRPTSARPRSATRTSNSSPWAISDTRTQGYSAREVDLFVWLEVLRDKQCDDRPCEVGVSCWARSSRAAARSRSTFPKCSSSWERASTKRPSN